MVICPRCGHGIPTAKQAREAKRRAVRDVDAAVRERVFKRDGYKCRQCGKESGLEIDHFFGRARDRSDLGCWTLCADCHRLKTENRPSRRYWLGVFRDHVAPLDAVRAVRVDELIAKDEGKRGA